MSYDLRPPERWTRVLHLVVPREDREHVGRELDALFQPVGVYGIVAYSVRGRTQEIGVRMALGANAASIRASVLRDGLLMIVPGTVLGILLAVPGARLLAGLLFGVSTLDPVVFGVVPLILAVASIVAVYIPSRRATSVDPAEALRAET